MLKHLPALLLTLTVTTAMPAQNLVNNGDLEGPTYSPWNHPLYGPTVVKLDHAHKEGVGSSKCLRIEAMVPRGERYWVQTIEGKIPSGSAVTLSAMVRTEEVSGLAYLTLSARKGRRVIASESTLYSTRISGTADWKRLTLTLEVPDGTDSLRVYAYLRGRGKAWFDDFILVPGKEAGSSASGPGKDAAGKGGAGPIKVTGGDREKAGIYEIRISLEAKATALARQARVITVLPALTANQLPLYFKANAFPANGIKSLKMVRKGGRKAPPLLEIEIMDLEPGRKVKLDLEGRVLILPRTAPAKVPAKLPAKLKVPGRTKQFLTPSNLSRSAEPAATALLGKAGDNKDFTARFTALVTGAGATPNPAITLAGALRTLGLPARLLVGMPPTGGATHPHLALETWLPGAGWLRVLPRQGVISPAPWQFILLAPVRKDYERRFSSTVTHLPEHSYLEVRGSLKLRGLRDRDKGLSATCAPALTLTTPPDKAIRARLVKAVTRNWERWLDALGKGNLDQDAAFAGQAASQTSDYNEMLRVLLGIG